MAIFSQFSSLQYQLYESSSIAILLDILTSAHIVWHTCEPPELIKFRAFFIKSSKFFQFNGLRGRSQIKQEFMFSVENFVFLLSLTLMHCLSPLTCYARLLFISDQNLRRFGNKI